MTKNEFVAYLDYLHKLFTFEMPVKEVMEAWYKPFINTSPYIAKKMADTYFQEEKGKFKLSKLIEYKSRIMAGHTYYKEKEERCPICDNTGYIQVEVPYRKSYTIVCKRCVCAIGESLSHQIRQVTKEELERIDHNGRIIRDWSLHLDLNGDEEEKKTSLDNLFKRMKGATA